VNGFRKLPQNYTGRSMSESHKHLKITEGEWAAFCKDFDDTMAKFNVPEAEHKELFAIVQSTKGNIRRGLFLCLSLRFRSVDQEVFQDKFPVCRCERLLADLAMDQSMREVGIAFHAHDLVVRPTAGADEIGRMALRH
jgi:hypothetical protein